MLSMGQLADGLHIFLCQEFGKILLTFSAVLWDCLTGILGGCGAGTGDFGSLVTGTLDGGRWAAGFLAC